MPLWTFFSCSKQLYRRLCLSVCVCVCNALFTMFLSLDLHETYTRHWSYEMLVARTIWGQRSRSQGSYKDFVVSAPWLRGYFPPVGSGPYFQTLFTLKIGQKSGFYPSALRAGGVLSSRSGRAGGCQTCGTHISVTAWWIFSIRSSVELSRPVGVHCHGHMPICPIWACPWAKNLSNLPQIGSRLCGTHISETAGWIYPI